MKISKIIFISLLSIIALLILASALDIRINGHRNGDLTDINSNKQILPSFKVLSITNCKNIDIIKSDSMLIHATWFKDSLSPKEIYTIKDDTLMISDIKEYVKIKISANESLRSILLKKSRISVSSIASPNIAIGLDKSYIFFKMEKNEKSFLKAMDITAKNHSTIGSNDFKIDSIRIVLRNSAANLGLHAKKISGFLSDSSSINTQVIEEISMKKDSTCKIYLFNFQ